MQLKQRHIVDSHKFLTTFVILGLMGAYNQWTNPTAWVYLALHGTYGMIWLVKSQTFPDKRWEASVTLPWAIGLFSTLALYWVTPLLIMTQGTQAPNGYTAVCIALYTLGIFLHYTADMQKDMVMRLRPGTLLKEGLWAKVRNPNYLGELLIYSGYGLLAMHWLPLAIIVAVVLVIWVPNMRQKDKSLSRYPDYAAYKRQSKWLIPFLI
jgi:protein-S-isoprenylcysteine O-methyltransferase Ste14